MPSERKPRPSFTPPETTSTSAEGSSTGWVYRSETPAGAPAEGDQRPAVLRWANAVERGTSRGAGCVVTTLSKPFEFIFLVTLPATHLIAWPFGQRRRTPPQS